MDETEKKKDTAGRKLPKKLLVAIIVILAMIAVCIPLAVTAPTEADFLENIPQSFLELEARRESVPSFDSIGIMTSYKAMKQIDASNVVSVTLLGIAGNVIDAGDNPVLNFFVNFVAWLPALLNGAKITILLTLASVVTGVLLSVFVALGKMAKFKPVQYFCRAYIFFFRGTPLLMQLYFLWFGLPLLFPALTINDRFVAAWIAFSLNSAAYCAEIIRAAIESIDKGQFEAAKVLGLSYGQTMSKIIIPQTYRRLIPPIANEFIMVLKDAALTSIIALQDLSKVTSSILSSSGEVSVYLIAMVIYLVITAVFSKIFSVLEKKFSVYE